MTGGDIIVAARGRRYFSNTPYLDILSKTQPTAAIALGDVPAVTIYLLDETTVVAIRKLAKAQS
jgi:hypothetical protein